jgi:hypothetical protein
VGANSWRRAERERRLRREGAGSESERRGREEAAEKLRREGGRDRFRVFFFSFYTRAGWIGAGRVPATKKF